jgi:signal peptidase I
MPPRSEGRGRRTSVPSPESAPRQSPRRPGVVPVLRRVVGVAVAALAGIALVTSLGCGLAGYRLLIVRTGSMTPGMPVGSAAITRPTDVIRLRVGDVVSFHPPQQPRVLVTHRIYRITTDRTGRSSVLIATKGDANVAPDPWVLRPADRLGRRIAVLPRAGYLLVTLNQPPALILIVIIGLLFLLLPMWPARSTKARRGRHALG